MSIRQDVFEGYVDRIENGCVFGWAWHSEIPNGPIEVDIYLDGERKANAVANMYRADLEAAIRSWC